MIEQLSRFSCRRVASSEEGRSNRQPITSARDRPSPSIKNRCCASTPGAIAAGSGATSASHSPAPLKAISRTVGSADAKAG